MKLSQSIHIKPSYWSQFLNGILFLLIIILIIYNIKDIMKMNIFNKLIILFLFGIYICLHGIGHLGLEYIYQYNPLETGKI